MGQWIVQSDDEILCSLSLIAHANIQRWATVEFEFVVAGHVIIIVIIRSFNWILAGCDLIKHVTGVSTTRFHGMIQ